MNINMHTVNYSSSILDKKKLPVFRKTPIHSKSIESIYGIKASGRDLHTPNVRNFKLDYSIGF